MEIIKNKKYCANFNKKFIRQIVNNKVLNKNTFLGCFSNEYHLITKINMKQIEFSHECTRITHTLTQISQYIA